MEVQSSQEISSASTPSLFGATSETEECLVWVSSVRFKERFTWWLQGQYVKYHNDLNNIYGLLNRLSVEVQQKLSFFTSL